MPHYSYNVINQEGATLTGLIDADSVEAASEKLSDQGYIPTRVVLTGAGSIVGWISAFQEKWIKVPQQDLILFTKQLRTMFHAGIPILTILETLEIQTQNEKLRKAIISISMGIREGDTLYESFGKHPHVFSELYCSMLKAGETSGSLPELLDRVIYILEHEYQLNSNIKSALLYPKIVVTALAIAFFVLLTFVIPKFERIFERVGVELPLPTRICLFLNNFLVNYWYILLALIAGIILLWNYYKKTEEGKFVRDSLMLKFPVVGSLFQKAAMSRFASVFSILQSSGVPVLDSIKTISKTIGNAAISREFDRIMHLLEEGHGIAKPLKSARYFTPMVTTMVAIGEESGSLDEMLREVSEHYDYEVNYTVSKLSEVIGPILVVGLVCVVGFFAFAIFLPMWDMTKIVK